MTRDQARMVKLSGDLLHSYLAGVRNGLPPTDQDLIDVIDGNFLLANAMLGMLAPLRRKSFDEVLNELPPRDEGFPDHTAGTFMWTTTVDVLKYARTNGWQRLPYPSWVYDVPTALRNSFNLAVTVTFEFAAQTDQSPAYVAKTFADAAAVGEGGPSEMGESRRGPGRFPQTAAWFGSLDRGRSVAVDGS